MAGRAIWQGRLSGASRRRTTVESTTLEPKTRGTAFDLKSNWIGLALLALGAILLIAGAADDADRIGDLKPARTGPASATQLPHYRLEFRKIARER